MFSYFEKHNKLSWIITILIAIAIFYISSQSFPQGSPGPEFTLKPIIYHLTAFFFLNLFLLVSITKGKTKNKTIIILAIILAILYAISDELHQYFVPGRTSTISDVLIDTIGILTATFIYTLRIKN